MIRKNYYEAIFYRWKVTLSKKKGFLFLNVLETLQFFFFLFFKIYGKNSSDDKSENIMPRVFSSTWHEILVFW